jgi:tetratricopeptide (TPR) repeat protein
MLELGHVGAAQQDFAEVAWMAHESGDVKGFAISSMNQGVTADVLCEWETALVSYNRAIAAFEDIGETTWISRCRHNMALTYRQLGKLDIARALFDQSYSEVSLNGGLNDILSLKSEMALLYEMAGDHELARKTAANALAAAESAVNPRRIAELLRVNAIIFRAESDARRAILLLRRGLTLARELGVTLLEAELLQELAACHLQLGMRRPALVNSNRAANAFRALGAERRAQAALQILETHAQAI